MAYVDIDLPADLEPLPTQPWTNRPADVPIELEEARTALYLSGGNVTEAAKLLRVWSGRLRAMLNESAYLQREMNEAMQRVLDKAERVMVDGLDDDGDVRYANAKFLLDRRAKERGYGTGNTANVSINAQGPVVIGWADGTAFGATDNTPMIDITPEQEAAE